MTKLFADVTPFRELDERSLGILAGQLRLRSVHRWSPLHEEGFTGCVAVAGPAALGRDGERTDAGVTGITGPGLAVTTRRRFGRVRVGLLPSSSMRLVADDAGAPATAAARDEPDLATPHCDGRDTCFPALADG